MQATKEFERHDSFDVIAIACVCALVFRTRIDKFVHRLMSVLDVEERRVLWRVLMGATTPLPVTPAPDAPRLTVLEWEFCHTDSFSPDEDLATGMRQMTLGEATGDREAIMQVVLAAKADANLTSAQITKWQAAVNMKPGGKSKEERLKKLQDAVIAYQANPKAQAKAAVVRVTDVASQLAQFGVGDDLLKDFMFEPSINPSPIVPAEDAARRARSVVLTTSKADKAMLTEFKSKLGLNVSLGCGGPSKRTLAMILEEMKEAVRRLNELDQPAAAGAEDANAVKRKATFAQYAALAARIRNLAVPLVAVDCGGAGACFYKALAKQLAVYCGLLLTWQQVKRMVLDHVKQLVSDK